MVYITLDAGQRGRDGEEKGEGIRTREFFSNGSQE
jgi:hypothetical protein